MDQSDELNSHVKEDAFKPISQLMSSFDLYPLAGKLGGHHSPVQFTKGSHGCLYCYASKLFEEGVNIILPPSQRSHAPENDVQSVGWYNGE